MKTKTWLILIGVILIFCLGLSLFVLLPGEASSHAQITSNGVLIKTVDLGIDQEFVISLGEGQWNQITVKDGAIAVTSATCPDHYCMHRGFCSSGADIVCLPNRLVIHFTQEQEIDAVIG